eukprot:715093-Rhodomonas_salina.5
MPGTDGAWADPLLAYARAMLYTRYRPRLCCYQNTAAVAAAQSETVVATPLWSYASATRSAVLT